MTQRSSGVHPRPRGEHKLFLLSKSPRYGSSPPARGTLNTSTKAKLKVRFIPARAGNTCHT